MFFEEFLIGEYFQLDVKEYLRFVIWEKVSAMDAVYHGYSTTASAEDAYECEKHKGETRMISQFASVKACSRGEVLFLNEEGIK